MNPEERAQAAWQLATVGSTMSLHYFDELYWLARELTKECEGVFGATAPTDAGFIRVDATLHGRIRAALGIATRIANLTRVPKSKGGNSASQFELQKIRARAILDRINGLELAEIRSNRVRNTLEHWDEYLDQTILNLSTGHLQRPALLFLDTILSSRDLLTALDLQGRSAHYLRIYVADEREYENCGFTVNLGRISDEALALSTHLFRTAPADVQEVWAGQERGAYWTFVS